MAEKDLEKLTATKLREIAKQYEGITGVHAMKKEELIQAIQEAQGEPRKTIKKDKAQSIGSLKKQIKALKELLTIAKENDLFVEIHSRFAVKQVLEVLEEFQYNKIIMHWFLDSKKYIDRAIKNGYYITIGPKYLYQEDLKANLNDVPTNKILFESDYPANVSGKIQEPKDIREIMEKYCKDFNVDFEEMLNIQKNALKIIFPKYFANDL